MCVNLRSYHSLIIRSTYTVMEQLSELHFSRVSSNSSGGSGFKPRFWDRLTWLRGFMVFLSPSRQNNGASFSFEGWAVIMLLLGVPGSNLGSETGWPHWGVSWFSSVPPGICRDGTSISPRQLLTTSFPCHYSVFITQRSGSYPPVPYSEGLGLKSGPWDKLFWLRAIVALLCPSRQMPE
jgi:hypothetical protein